MARPRVITNFICRMERSVMDGFVEDRGSLALEWFSKGGMPKAPLPNLGGNFSDTFGLFLWS